MSDPWLDTPEHPGGCGCPSTPAGDGLLVCTGCGDLWEATPEQLEQARAAQAWWDRDDREEAWAEVLRLRKVDAIAAEHNARQLSLLPEP